MRHLSLLTFLLSSVAPSLAQGADAESTRAAVAAVVLDPRASTGAASVTSGQAVVEGGARDQRLSGRVSVPFGAGLVGELSLASPTFGKSAGRSDLLQIDARAPGGEIGLGLVYTTFGYEAAFQNAVRTQCAQQDGEASGEVAVTSRALDEKRSALDDAKRRGDAASAAIVEATTAIEKARADEDTDARSAAEARLEDAQSKLVAASRDAERLAPEVRGLEASLARKKCVGFEQLSPERQKRAEAFEVSYLVFARFVAGARQTDYVDLSTGRLSTENARPIGVAVGLAAVLRPTLLVGAGLEFRADRKVGDVSSVCRDLPIGGVTTSPNTYACSDRALGAPAARYLTTLRLELRHYLKPWVGWNPSASFTYASSEFSVKLFSGPGRLSFELPIFFRLAERSPLLFGGAVAYRRTVGTAESANSTDISAFLAGTFALADVVR